MTRTRPSRHSSDGSPSAQERAYGGSTPPLEAFFSLSDELLAVLDPTGVFKELNSRWEEVLGIAVGQLTGRPLLDLVLPDERDLVGLWLRRPAAADGQPLTLPVRLLDRNGRVCWMVLRARRVVDVYLSAKVGAPPRTPAASPLDPRRLDPLTRLPERTSFVEALEERFADRRATGRGHMAVLFVDLDHFKRVNDSLGHEAGDRILVETARRLQSGLRPADAICRFGGDEFAALLELFDGETEARRVAERLADGIARPVDLGDRTVSVTASIGIALGAHDGYAQAIELVRDADRAMYQAKNLGRARCCLYDQTARQRDSLRDRLRGDLEEALSKRQLEVFYQPRAHIEDGHTEIRGFEALLRWRHPELGLMLPSDFLDLTEESGLMPTIESWLLRSGCEDLSRWRRQHPERRKLFLSVNLSVASLADPHLLRTVREALGDSELASSNLQLELAEESVLRLTSEDAARLDELRDLGVHIYMDDFGTGRSSLWSLQQCPLHGVKIDHAFVRDLPGSKRAVTVTRSILALARALTLEVVAEGVERREQITCLEGLGCHWVEGPLLGEPARADEACALLA
jgi:diguanylate cyclase (GGDEF)-like protein/PAS domain S-box-containing protein